jgi:hypothetical protein
MYGLPRSELGSGPTARPSKKPRVVTPLRTTRPCSSSRYRRRPGSLSKRSDTTDEVRASSAPSATIRRPKTVSSQAHVQCSLSRSTTAKLASEPGRVSPRNSGARRDAHAAAPLEVLESVSARTTTATDTRLTCRLARETSSWSPHFLFPVSSFRRSVVRLIHPRLKGDDFADWRHGSAVGDERTTERRSDGTGNDGTGDDGANTLAAPRRPFPAVTDL